MLSNPAISETLRNLFAVAIGGALGSVARYLAGLAIGGGRLPWATLFVNVLGSFLLALLAQLALARGASESLRLFATVGICGGFTTYSTFNAELLALGPMKGALYGAVTIAVCLIAGLLGHASARALY